MDVGRDTAFFKGFDDAGIRKIERVITKIKNAKKSQEIKKAKAEIKRLEAKIKRLSK